MAQFCIHSEGSSKFKPSRFEGDYNYCTFKEAEELGIQQSDIVFITSFDEAIDSVFVI